MMKRDNSGDPRSDHGEPGPNPVNLEPDVWRTLFQTTQVPIFVEDMVGLRPLVQDVLARVGRRNLRHWLDAHPDFVGRFIASVKILDVNEAAVKLNAAASREELLVSLERLVVPETLAVFKDLICVIAEDKGYYEGECRFRALDGREYHALNRAWVPRADDPEQLMTIVTVDITDLKLVERALAESEERYRLLIETAQDAIVRHDLEGRITFINQAGVDMLGRPREQIIGNDGAEFLTPESYAEALQRRATRQSGNHGVLLYETEFLHAAGHSIPVEVSSTLLPGPLNGTGEPQILLVARDISQRRLSQQEQQLAEARLRDAQKLESLGVLAGGIAHDFNNLLVAIMGNAELMRADLTVDGKHQQSLDAIMEAGDQAAELCRQMQAYAGAAPTRAEVQDLSQVVTALQHVFRVSVSDGSHLYYQLATELPDVFIDAAQVRQVIIGMVSNAVEAVGHDGGEIIVRTGVGVLPTGEPEQIVGGEALSPGEYVFCEVCDSGPGMDQATVARMFEPFFSTKFAGRGLGMSAALGIVRGHGGGFKVESEPDQGTAVSFWLPVHESPAAQRNGNNGSSAGLSHDLKGRTILIVDDNANVRAVAESYLRRLGCKVLSAADGFDAVRLFGQRHAEVDAVILDYAMPGMDGASTSRRLRVIRPDVPLLISSGYDEAGIKAKYGDLGMAGFVAKPYNLRELNEVLAQVLNG